MDTGKFRTSQSAIKNKIKVAMVVDQVLERQALELTDYKEALEWYAVRGNHDYGHRAREILTRHVTSEVRQ